MEIIISKSDKKGKKYMAKMDGKTIHFGASGYDDFTTHKDEERKQRYINRHQKREKWGEDGIETAGFYSRWVTWNLPTIKDSIADLNKRYSKYTFKYI